MCRHKERQSTLHLCALRENKTSALVAAPFPWTSAHLYFSVPTCPFGPTFSPFFTTLTSRPLAMCEMIIDLTCTPKARARRAARGLT